MIIFGTRGVKSTLKEGTFHCPQCATQKNYKHKKVTKFFTLYFIPIIPLERLGDFVECQSCRGTFIAKVLDYQKQPSADQFLSEYEKAMKHSMVLMMLADGEIDDNEMLTVQKIINKFGHNDVTLDELEQYVEEVKHANEDVTTYLKKVGPALNEHGKEIVIKCALSVAAADGNIDPEEIKMIEKMARIMEMSSTHLKGIIMDITQPTAQTFSQN